MHISFGSGLMSVQWLPDKLCIKEEIEFAVQRPYEMVCLGGCVKGATNCHRASMIH